MFLYENILNMREPDKILFVEHIKTYLLFQNYFFEEVQQHNWIKNPFITDLSTELPICEKE